MVPGQSILFLSFSRAAIVARVPNAANLVVLKSDLAAFHVGEDRVDKRPQRAQRMRGGDAFFQRAVTVQGVLSDVGLAHDAVRKCG